MNAFKLALFISAAITYVFITHGRAEASIDAFLSQYKRPITVLEITDTQKFCTLSSAHLHKGVFVFLCQADKIDSIKKKVQDFSNVVLLHSKAFSTTSLVELSSCEHFDVTFIHEWNILYKNPYIVSALLSLGDYLIIDIDRGFSAEYFPEDIKNKILWKENLFPNKERIYLKNEKTFLDKARWIMSAKAHAKQPSYTILSTFNEKKLIKGSEKKTSDWVPGINLVTAIMLNVIYPTNEILRENIKRFMAIDHNDPVIGNMIVQGKVVELIDFADSRRNANQEKCINAALKLFTWIHRSKDPLEAIQKYSGYVNK